MKKEIVWNTYSELCQFYKNKHENFKKYKIPINLVIGITIWFWQRSKNWRKKEKEGEIFLILSVKTFFLFSGARQFGPSGALQNYRQPWIFFVLASKNFILSYFVFFIGSISFLPKVLSKISNITSGPTIIPIISFILKQGWYCAQNIHGCRQTDEVSYRTDVMIKRKKR